MSVTKDTLERLDSHWAVQAIGAAVLKRAFELVKVRVVKAAVGVQMRIDIEEKPNESEMLGRVAMAYEVAAIEGLNALLYPSSDAKSGLDREQAQAGAYQAYEIRRTIEIPENDDERVQHVLHLASLAYCGDRWTDVRRWMNDNETKITAPSVANAKWDRRVLFRLYDCWVRLLRKKQWDDLDSVREIIAGLRKDQATYEESLLKMDGNAESTSAALRLVALYHWAKATELIAVFNLQGDPVAIDTELDKHFEGAIKAASACRDIALEILLRWLHVTARRMAAGSLWKVAHLVNSRVTAFVKSVTKSRSLFELLPPQRAALQEQGLLDQAHRAVIVDLPTSGGKTALAQFRILQALNQFDADNGWVAYVAPTRALVSQLTRRLREDFSPLGIRVEQLTGAVEIDAFEEDMLKANDAKAPFHVLISTPEKLQLVIRNKKVTRPLALIVLDEAHNIEDMDRGLRIELLLATIKKDCPKAHYLLLMPFVPNASDLASWLAPDAGKSISIGTSAWQPNERIIGSFDLQKEEAIGRSKWSLHFQTLTTSPKTIQLRGKHQVGEISPLDVKYGKAKSLICQTGAMAKVFSARGTSVAIATRIPDTWSMARIVAQNLPPFPEVSPEIKLVQRFLQTEISPNFELIELLEKGVGVHHAGLSDETRSLIEWLTETGELRVLCATTTLAQGINFPVASVFLASVNLALAKPPYQRAMSSRAFWNLAGRAGRIGQENVGVVGIASGNKPTDVVKFVGQKTEALISRLIQLLDDVEKRGKLHNLSLIIKEDQWSDFRCYIAHLLSEKKELEVMLSETEQLLRNTLGYQKLKSQTTEKSKKKTEALIKATRDYALEVSNSPERIPLAEATGFAPEGVMKALIGLNQLERKLTPSDWEPTSLFGPTKSHLPHLIGVMMTVPQISEPFKELIGSQGLDDKRLAQITSAWVMGSSIQDIAKEYFKKGTETDKLTQACRAIYRNLTNGGAWGISALSKMPTSGIDFENISADSRRKINCLPAMIYHGVSTEAAVLMRMNCVPRSVAVKIGEKFAANASAPISNQTVGTARDFLRRFSEADWDKVRSPKAAMSGKDYKTVWERLSGEHAQPE